MHMMRIYHYKPDILSAHELAKVKPIVSCRFYAYHCLFKITFLHQFHNCIVKAVESLHKIRKRHRFPGKLNAPPVKSPEKMLLTSDIDADNHCCFFYLRNLLVLCRIHLVDTFLFCSFANCLFSNDSLV